MYPENTTRARPCSGMGASLGARALCALLGRAPLLTSLRARRSGASNAAGPAVAAYGRKPAAHTQPGPASRREAGPTSLRAPRVARTPSPRSALRASLGRFKRSRASSGSVYGRKPVRSQGRERGARQDPTSLRAPRVARTPSPRSALRASLGRFKRSRAGSGSVRQAASGAQTQPGPGSRREEEGPTSLRAPRVARTPPPLITSLRAPRVARNARPHERSALVAPCVGRWRAALAR